MRSVRLAVLALLLSAAPASAQITRALDLVPDDALGFVLIKDLRQLSDKVEQLASKLKAPEHVSFLELVQMSLGRGLNEKGSAVIIVMKGKVKSELATESPPLGFALSTFPGGVEAQFVIPYGALQAVFEGIRSADEKKEKK
jgi:hypothetical protein